ncbi:hypothetical protein FKG94_07600 [Exilibacterium tricleocarpae]|uniref:Insecticide toxin TcdB middle/N-terminal domain-containing protein n=1 Tax=Exilibacterium tricleocarpae TaxID=2591008 RepID=A0A545TZE2_9GAMM|nr:FG-GAP-like repeat-containing protein [Exilibacterium tricleocarpae]TQV82588.1 hypothetical protein FKG94_07600 [Exilibacterium tricleocarpae]
MSSFRAILTLFFFTISCFFSAAVSAYTDAIHGEFSVSNGAVNYTIPIDVSPGRGGMQPELSLSYNGYGNDVLGLSWGLNGLSAISRCPATLAQDGFVAGINFDERDRFCLNGQRLVPVATTAAGSVEYRTEIDSYAKILSEGGSAVNPDRFIVQTKSGEVIIYGGAHNATLGFPQGNTSWSIQERSDSTGNNTITYRYRIDENTQYLDEIIYIGGRVEIVYEQRPDIVRGYFKGNATNKRLIVNTISTYRGDVPLQHYRINYENIGFGSPSRMEYIRICNADGGCLITAGFDWGIREPQEHLIYNKVESALCADGSTAYGGCNGNNNYSTIQYADVTGDGFSDVCFRADQGIRCYPGSREGFDFSAGIVTDLCADNSRQYGECDGTDNYNSIRFIDMNIDGLADIVYRSDDGVRIWYATGDGFVPGAISRICANGNNSNNDCRSSNFSSLAYPDIDGDGYNDLCYRSNQGIRCHFGGIDGFDETAGIVTEICANASSSNGVCNDADNHKTIQYKDMNADGKADIVYRSDAGIRVWHSTGTAFVLGVSSAICANGSSAYGVCNDDDNHLRMDYVDVNGDGMLDVCFRADQGITCIPGTGVGFDTAAAISTELCANGSTKFGICNDEDNWDTIRYLDINADGRADLVFRSDQGLRIWYSEGNRFRQKVKNRICLNWSHGRSKCNSIDNHLSLSYLDLNGDGMLDVAYRGDDGIVVHFSKDESKPLRTISFGFRGGSSKTEIYYKRLTNPEVYTKGNTAIFPVVELQHPQYVVSKVETDNGAGGIASVLYHYAGLKTHVLGRGSLGYAQITESFPDTGKSTVTTFDQRDFPYTGNVLHVEERYHGERVNTADYVNAAVETYPGVYRMDTISSTQTSYELDQPNVPVTTVTTTHEEIDRYGNVGVVKVTTAGGGDTFSTTTYNQYRNDIEKWYLGRLTETRVEHRSPYGADEHRIARFTYDDLTGLLTSETTVGGRSESPLTTTSYVYDGFGQKTAISVMAAGDDEHRTSTSEYTDDGKVARQCNAYQECETYAYTPQGWLSTSTGPNGITTRWTHDGWGREIREDRADGTYTTIDRIRIGKSSRQHDARCGALDTATPNSPHFCKVTTTSGSAPQIEHFDFFGRKLRSISTGFDGRPVYTDTRYNRFGEVSRISRPYYEGEQVYWATSDYDALDRVIRIVEPGPHGTTTETTTVYNGLITTSRAGPDGLVKTVHSNARGQKIRIEEEESSYIEYTYNSDGNLLTTEVAGDPQTRITLTYDEFGRKISMDDPDMGVWRYTYTDFGELKSQTDAKGQTTIMEYDALGRMVRRIDPDGTTSWRYGDASSPPGSVGKLLEESGQGVTNRYAYDAFGRPISAQIEIAGEGSFETQTQYDALGRVSRTLYPGEHNFYTENVYSDMGFLLAVTGSRAQAEPHDYEALAPLVSEATDLAQTYLTEAEDLRAIGEFYRAQIAFFQQAAGCCGPAPEGFAENLATHQTILQDNIAQGQALSPEFWGHLNAAIAELEAVNRLIDDQIDNYLEVAGQLTVLAEQTLAAADNSFRIATALAGSAGVYEDYRAEQTGDLITYWKAVDVDASGRISAEVYGNGIVNDYAYDQRTGQLDSIHSSLLVFNALRHLEYEYDAYQNVTLRDDLTNDIRETYAYDRLNRLTNTEVVSNLYANTADLNTTQSLNYDVLGNITHKSDVGAYHYGAGNAGPHAVTLAGGNTYTYDANGNMTGGNGRTIQWSSFNKPTQITQGGRSATFSYGPDRARFKKVNHRGDVTLYAGLLEQTTKANGDTDAKHYIYAAGRLVAEHIVSSTEGTQTRYLHKDALGSVDLVTDAYANVVDRRSFDAWGKLRDLPWQSQASLDDPLYLTQLPFTNKGYTGHESVQEVNLIHMNGRMYDATLGRFISADPYIQADGRSQSYNRYSYVLNNPMKYTDPSGYFLKKLFKKIGRGLRRAWRAFKPYIGIAVGAVLMASGCIVCGPGWVSGVLNGAVVGALAGAAGAAGVGGNIFRGALMGGLSGGVFAGIGLSGLGRVARVGAHALAGGTISVIQGGKFGTGFFSAGFTKFATLQLSDAGVLNAGDSSTRAVIGRTTMTAVVGGTASVIGGGKFANGAATVAFASFFNGVVRRYKPMALQQAGARTTVELRYKNIVGGDAIGITNPRWYPQHGYVIVRDNLTGEEWISRAGPGGEGGNIAFGSIKAVTVRNVPGSTSDYGAQVNYSQVVLTTDMAPQSIVNSLSSFTNSVNQAQISYNPFVRNSNSYANQAVQSLTGARPPTEVWAPGARGVLEVNR